MNPQDNNPSGRPPSLYQMSTQRERKGGGGMIVLALVLLLLAAGAAYYFLKMRKPAAVAAALPAAATPRPRPAATPTGYNSVTEQSYIDQADKAFMELQGPKKQAFDDALKAYGEAGGVSPKGLTSKEAVTARRGLIAKLIAANDDFATFASTEDALYREQLGKTPLTPHDIDETFRTYQDKAKSPLFIKIREAQHAELQSGDDMMAALEKNYGNWSLSPAGKLSFKRPADATAYNELAQKFNANVQALNKLQDEFRSTADPDGATAPSTVPGASTAPAATPATTP